MLLGLTWGSLGCQNGNVITIIWEVNSANGLKAAKIVEFRKDCD
jgi:hypothetical protein